MGKRIAFLTAAIFSGIIVIAVVVAVVLTATGDKTVVPGVEQVVMKQDEAAMPTTCDFAALKGKAINEIDLSVFGQRPVRVLRPGDMATMDYSPVRINIMLDAHDMVADVTCG